MGSNAKRILDIIQDQPEMESLLFSAMITNLQEPADVVRAYELCPNHRDVLGGMVLAADLSFEEMDRLYQVYPELHSGLAKKMVIDVKNRVTSAQISVDEHGAHFQACSNAVDEARGLVTKTKNLVAKYRQELSELEAELPAREALVRKAAAGKTNAKKALQKAEALLAVVMELHAATLARFPEAAVEEDHISEGDERPWWEQPDDESEPDDLFSLLTQMAGPDNAAEPQAHPLTDEDFQILEEDPTRENNAVSNTQPVRVTSEKTGGFWRGIGNVLVFIGRIIAVILVFIWSKVIVPAAKFVWNRWFVPFGRWIKHTWSDPDPDSSMMMEPAFDDEQTPA